MRGEEHVGHGHGRRTMPMHERSAMPAAAALAEECLAAAARGSVYLGLA